MAPCESRGSSQTQAPASHEVEISYIRIWSVRPEYYVYFWMCYSLSVLILKGGVQNCTSLFPSGGASWERGRCPLSAHRPDPPPAIMSVPCQQEAAGGKEHLFPEDAFQGGMPFLLTGRGPELRPKTTPHCWQVGYSLSSHVPSKNSEVILLRKKA